MQPLNWYVRRLSAMSPSEAVGRAADAARDALDALRLSAGWTPTPPSGLLREHAPRFRVSDVAVGEWGSAPEGSPEASWRDRLNREAAELLAHRLTFFDLERHDFGPTIDWNRDCKSGRRGALRFGRWVDYRDLSKVGDCKLVWEPNRHHHLVVLGRAYRATGDERYAAEVASQLEAWMIACPFGRGMNWRSPLELGIRLMNWVWALDLIRESGWPDELQRARILASVHQHVWEVTRRYSDGSSANNHLVGEAAGVFVATAYFDALDPDGRLHDESRSILVREIVRQSHEDGGTREQGLGYQMFVLQFYLVVDAVAHAIGRPLPTAFEARLERMLGFVCRLTEGGPLPLFGDADDGRVLDLGGSGLGWLAWLGAGAVRFDRPDLAAVAEVPSEPARWLLGRGSIARLADLRARAGAGTLKSAAMAPSGIYLLQAGTAGHGVSVIFDCGELGFGELAAHGHADALSFVLRAFGEDVLVDPGTYDYFSFPEWRSYFRSTRAHNTVEVDGVDQSTMAGPFLWGQKASARCLTWLPAPDGGRVSGEHDGYGRLSDPVTHRRTLELAGQPSVLRILDEVDARGEHDVALHFHTAETITVAPAGDRAYELRARGGTAVLTLDAGLEVEVRRGIESPIAGWVSRGYHRRSPATTIVGRTRVRGTGTFACRIEIVGDEGRSAPR